MAYEEILGEAQALVTRLCEKFLVSPVEYAALLRTSSVEERLRVSLVVIAERRPGVNFTQRQIAEFINSSRESVTRAVARMRRGT
jgi:CRP-like cAMP-binding protein